MELEFNDLLEMISHFCVGQTLNGIGVRTIFVICKGGGGYLSLLGNCGTASLGNKVDALPPIVQTVIKTAIDWHAHGNRYASCLNRFVNYWESIELLGHFFYEKLPADVVQRKTKIEKKDMILHLLKEVTHDNCMDAVKKCNEIRMPTVRTKVLAFLKNIPDLDSRMEALLFKPDDRTGKSLYQIRNDIAHGNLSEHHFETIESFSHRLFDAKKISRQIILLSIKNAEKLTQQLTEHGE